MAGCGGPSIRNREVMRNFETNILPVKKQLEARGYTTSEACIVSLSEDEAYIVCYSNILSGLKEKMCGLEGKMLLETKPQIKINCSPHGKDSYVCCGTVGMLPSGVACLHSPKNAK